MTQKLTIEDIAAFCKKKGFIFQAASIYGGLSGFFDFGPLGVELKQNLKNSYWKHFVQKREDMVGQDGSIITNPKVWKASGHVDNFADLILTTKKTKTKLRADHFVEDKLNINADGLKATEINELILKHQLTHNGEEFEEIKDFNLMFHTQVGADTSKNATAYLRPETCQSIFPNFRLITDVSRAKLPFGIVQIGKAFRNEISPRDFIFRCREFEQIEMEYFFNPKTTFKVPQHILDLSLQFLNEQAQIDKKDEMQVLTIQKIIEKKILEPIHAYWLGEFLNWLMDVVGFKPENLRIRQHLATELSHYSKATVDIDYKFPFGFKEMIGVAHRGNYDLTQHQDHSKQKLEFFDETEQEKLLPHVIEPSMGVERFFLATICEGYSFDEKRENIVLKLPPKVAPFQVAVLPLVKKDGLLEIAQEIKTALLEDFVVFFDTSGSIGRRYARQDEIGTPYCITIDYDTKEKGVVTIRNRDSTKQMTVKTDDIVLTIQKLLKKELVFE